MFRTTIIILAVAGLSFAQTSTVTLLIPGADTQSLVASIVAADATATTYAFQCAPGTDSNDCGFDGINTLTEGSATAAITFPATLDSNGSLAFTGYIDCSLAGTTSAVCVESFGGNEANFPGISTETYTGTDQGYMPVVITAGAAVVSTSSEVVASTTESSSKGSNNSNTSTKTSGGTSTGARVAQTSSVSSRSSTSTSTAGVPAITGNSVLGMGAAALMIAMM